MCYLVSQTNEFLHWMRALRDRALYFRITARLAHMRAGDLGDATEVGDHIYEASIAAFPTLHIYFYKNWLRVVVLFASDAQTSRNADIAKAKVLSQEFQEEYALKEKLFGQKLEAK